MVAHSRACRFLSLLLFVFFTFACQKVEGANSKSESSKGLSQSEVWAAWPYRNVERYISHKVLVAPWTDTERPNGVPLVVSYVMVSLTVKQAKGCRAFEWTLVKLTPNAPWQHSSLGGSTPVSCQAKESIDATRESESDFDTFLAAKTKEFNKTGTTLSGQLEQPPGQKVQIEKGHCYAFVVRPSSGAVLKTSGIGIFLDGWPDAATGGAPSSLTVGPRFSSSTGAVFMPSCAGGAASVMMRPTGSGARAIGRGAFVLEVLEREASSEELKNVMSRAAMLRQQNIDESRAFKTALCRQCGRERTEKEQRICLERRGSSMRDCGW